MQNGDFEFCGRQGFCGERYIAPEQPTRRAVLRTALQAGCVFALSPAAHAQVSQAAVATWMTEWMQSKSLFGRLHLSRFVEPIYFLTQPTTWRPAQSPSQSSFAEVTVPKGFITDFASIPRVFWSLLRPDGEYAHAAVIHDYLYWNQARSRVEADSIFKYAMEDLGVDASVVDTLYNAVQVFGSRAWAENFQLKRAGERRVLKRFPDEVGTRWQDWQKMPHAFADE